MLTYQSTISLSSIPASIAKRLENIQCRFLWGDENGNRKYHLIRWEEVKKPVLEGGLGLKSIVELNRAFYEKRLWRSFGEERKLWWKVVHVRWGDWERENGRMSKFKPHRLSLWRNIRDHSHCIKGCVGWQG